MTVRTFKEPVPNKERETGREGGRTVGGLPSLTPTKRKGAVDRPLTETLVC